MDIYIIKINNNIMGFYNNLQYALDYIYSLKNSALININNKVYIETYKINSYILIDKYEVNLNYNITTFKQIDFLNKPYEHIIKPTEHINKDDNEYKYEYDNDNENEYENESFNITTEEIENKKNNINKFNKIGQEKIELVHELNLLKEKKKMIEEEEKSYNYNLDLYFNFKNKKINNNSFTIPFMFEDKYKLFEYLESNNLLNFDHFIDLYKPIKIQTNYDSLFVDKNIKIIDDDYNESISDVPSYIDSYNNTNNNDNETVFKNIDNEELILLCN